jgi:hypothetical protein
MPKNVGSYAAKSSVKADQGTYEVCRLVCDLCPCLSINGPAALS